MFTYALSDRLPQAGQRALSFLPGLEVDSQVALDASGTWGIRREMYQIGWNMIPQYFWLGRGFSSGAYAEDFSAYRFSPTLAAHVAMGRFYNGFVGLMVNTGVFGFIGMTIFIIGGLLLALRIIRHVRRYGADDNPSRVAALVAGIYIYSVIAFYFLHGDSEFAMKSFALQSGMMIMAERLLARRVAEGVA
jgi:O-antigen ligase